MFSFEGGQNGLPETWQKWRLGKHAKQPVPPARLDLLIKDLVMQTGIQDQIIYTLQPVLLDVQPGPALAFAQGGRKLFST